ncbi:MAG: hypothetical protein V1735_04070 [Nanoarchaeota archaeon]
MRSIPLIVAVLLSIALCAALTPQAPVSMDFVSNTSPAPGIGLVVNTTRGYINYVTLNATTQTFRWLGYVGNISGTVALSDASENKLYAWDVSNVRGEIYATRNSSTVAWGDIRCANESNITNEQGALSFESDDPDSINRTFNSTTHRSFYVGEVLIGADTCRSTALYSNSTAQADFYQEILLTDGPKMIYTGLINGSQRDFTGNLSDFQIILPSYAQDGPVENLAYYFYVELQ